MRLPSLVRFLVIAAFIGALVYAGMVALVTFVEVSPRPMEQAIPSGNLNK